MADTTYTITYVANIAPALKAMDQLEARANKLDANLNRMSGRMSQIGANTAGLVKLIAALKQAESSSGSAAKALAGVGKGNSSLSAYEKRMVAATAALNAGATAANAAGSAMAGVGAGGPPAGGGGGGGGKAGGGMTAGVVKALRTTAVVAGIRAGQRALGDSMAARHEFVGQTAEAASTFRADLTGLANLRGKKAGADNELMREQIAFQKATGQGPDEAAAFRASYLGAIDPGLQKGNITPQAAAEFETKAGLFAKRYDIDPKSAGKLAGLLPMYGKVASADQGLGMMAQSAEFLNLSGLGTPSEQMPGLIGLAASMLEDGAVDDEGNPIQKGRSPNMPALASTFALTTYKTKTPGSAGTQITQADRLLRKFDNPLIKAAGITPDDDYDSALRKFSAHLKGKDPDIEMKAAKLNNSTERLSVKKQMDLIESVDLARNDPRMLAAFTDANADNERYKGSKPFQQALAENTDFESVIESGIGHESMRTMRTMAEARMKDERQPGGDRLHAGVFGTLNDWRMSAFSGFGVSGQDIRIDREAFNNLVKGGEQAGVDVAKMAPKAAYDAYYGYSLDSVESRQQIAKAYEAVEAAGGDPMGGAPKNPEKAAMSKKAAEAAKNLGDLARMLQQDDDKKAQANAKGAPAVQAARR